MPSPTIPNTSVAPHVISVSTRMSDVFRSLSKRGAGCGEIAAATSEGLAVAASDALLLQTV